jgi:acyl carrier protein
MMKSQINSNARFANRSRFPQTTGRAVDLFESGFVDSVGVIELLAFVNEEFGIEVPDSALLSEQFATIDGMAAIIAELIASSDVSALSSEATTATAPETTFDTPDDPERLAHAGLVEGAT